VLVGARVANVLGDCKGVAMQLLRCSKWFLVCCYVVASELVVQGDLKPTHKAI